MDNTFFDNLTKYHNIRNNVYSNDNQSSYSFYFWSNNCFLLISIFFYIICLLVSNRFDLELIKFLEIFIPLSILWNISLNSAFKFLNLKFYLIPFNLALLIPSNRKKLLDNYFQSNSNKIKSNFIDFSYLEFKKNNINFYFNQNSLDSLIKSESDMVDSYLAYVLELYNKEIEYAKQSIS